MKLLVTGLVAALAACGGTKDDAPPEPTAAKTDDKRPAPDEAKPAPKPDEAKPVMPNEPPDAAMGTCQVKVTGGVKAEWTGEGGTTASAISYWFKPGDPNDKMMFDGKPGMILNCVGKGGRLSFIANAKTGATDLTFGPKTYTLAKGKKSFTVMASAGKDSTLSATGTLDVKQFDSTHIAGSFDLDAKFIDGGASKITGTFDFKCPGYGACGK